MQSPKIIVIIVSYNGVKWIHECIRSIIDNNYEHYQIAVVDNASRDATVSIIKENFGDVILLNQKRNLGYGSGANVGIQYAITQKADYILLLNQDIKLERNCIENIIAECENNREIGIASPLQMNYDGSRIDPHFVKLYNLKSDFMDINDLVNKDSFEVDTVIGASMLFRADVIQTIGYFDPIFFLYHEEGDLCRRAKYHGFQIHIIPKAVVYHKHIQLSPKEMTFKSKFCATYGYYIYTLKNPFLPFHQNFHTMLTQMKEWICRDHHILIIIKRFMINAAAALIVLICLPRIIKSRMSDMMIKAVAIRMIDQNEAIKEMPPVTKPGLCFFVFAYWHDARFISKAGGPIKVYELTHNLTKRDHQVYLFIPKIGYPEQQTMAHVCPVPFIDLPVLRFISFQLLAFFWALRIALRNKYPDIIYVRIMWSFIPMLLGRILSVPVILEINDSPHQAYTLINNPFKRAVVRLIDRISFHLSNHILPVTQQIAENIHILESVPYDKLTVLPSGTNIDLFHPMEKHQCCQKLGFNESLTYIGFIGTFFRHQGIDTLIDAAPFIVKKYPQVRFLILGDGPMRAAWSKKLVDNSLISYFIFPGNVPYEEVPSYCGVMDVCVAPFLKEAVERSPVKIFDYLACGKPVVATDVGETSGFFADSGAVLIVPPEDPTVLAQGLNRLLENETLRAEMGKTGRTFIANRYSRTQIAEIVETIAVKLLPSR